MGRCATGGRCGRRDGGAPLAACPLCGHRVATVTGRIIRSSFVGAALDATGSVTRRGHGQPVGAAGGDRGKGGLEIGVRGVERSVPFADALAKPLKAPSRVGIAAHQGAPQSVDGLGLVVTDAGRRGLGITPALAGGGRGAGNGSAGGGADNLSLAEASRRVVGVVKAAPVAKNIVLADVLEVVVGLGELGGGRRPSSNGWRSVSALVRRARSTRLAVTVSVNSHPGGAGVVVGGDDLSSGPWHRPALPIRLQKRVEAIPDPLDRLEAGSGGRRAGGAELPRAPVAPCPAAGTQNDGQL